MFVSHYSMIHVRHQFHAVGHGTFFTSIVEGDGNQTFSWVYDCGSKWPASLKSSLASLDLWENWPTDEVDLLAISHFDDDHINGLELLLEKRRVKWLVLPYLNFKDRLHHASEVVDGTATSPDAAVFALDPVGFLAARGLSKRIGALAFVVNPGEGQVGEASELVPFPSPDLEHALRPRDTWQTSLRLFPRVNSADEPRVVEWRHNLNMGSEDLRFELLFYNSALANDVAPISGNPLNFIAADVVRILNEYRVTGSLNPPIEGWQKQLRALYDLNFGRSGMRRNAISLCAFFRPIGIEFSTCAKFLPFPDHRGITISDLELRKTGNGVLLTGDLRLNAKSIQGMKDHFGAWRWEHLSAVQVPHHGSRHSWTSGNASLFPGPNFIQCVPTDRSDNHPHNSVTSDLDGHIVVCANYERSVYINTILRGRVHVVCRSLHPTH